MDTLDGNLSNPLDQKLHILLGHLQYLSPIPTIIYISHSLHNLQYITQPTQQHTTYTIHIQQHLHTTTLYTQLHGHVDIHAGLMHSHAGLMHSHAGLMQSHAGLMQAHADPMQAVMQSHVLSTPILLILLSITHLIQGPELFLPTFHHFSPSFVDRLCMHMTCQVFSPSVLVVPLCSMAFSGQHKSLSLV